jgi:hypothetical protein
VVPQLTILFFMLFLSSWEVRQGKYLGLFGVSVLGWFGVVASFIGILLTVFYRY